MGSHAFDWRYRTFHSCLLNDPGRLNGLGVKLVLAVGTFWACAVMDVHVHGMKSPGQFCDWNNVGLAALLFQKEITGLFVVEC